MWQRWNSHPLVHISKPPCGQGGVGVVSGLVPASGKGCVTFEQSLLKATVLPPAPSLYSSAERPSESTHCKCR